MACFCIHPIFKAFSQLPRKASPVAMMKTLHVFSYNQGQDGRIVQEENRNSEGKAKSSPTALTVNNKSSLEHRHGTWSKATAARYRKVDLFHNWGTQQEACGSVRLSNHFRVNDSHPPTIAEWNRGLCCY